MNEARIEIVAHCSECDQAVLVPWPDGEYWATLEDQITLDGQVQLLDGWYAKPGSYGGDNRLRCPHHSARYLAELAEKT